MGTATALTLTGALLLLAGCDPGRIGHGQPPVATLTKSGPFVRVNGRPAPAGIAIRPGDHVATGEFSSALIVWKDGTTVQLDEDTDPLFEWDGEPPDTLVINIGFGVIRVDTVNTRSAWATPSPRWPPARRSSSASSRAARSPPAFLTATWRWSSLRGARSVPGNAPTFRPVWP